MNSSSIEIYNCLRLIHFPFGISVLEGIFFFIKCYSFKTGFKIGANTHRKPYSRPLSKRGGEDQVGLLSCCGFWGDEFWVYIVFV